MTVTAIHFPDSMVDYEYHRGGSPAVLAPPHRKPLPPAPKVPVTPYQQEPQVQQFPQTYHPLHPSANQASQFNTFPQPSSTSSSHSRTRTTSSSVFPHSATTPSPPNSSTPDRRFSSQTSSASGFSNNQPAPTMPPTQQYQHHIHRSGTNNSTNSTAPRRSTSSRSSTLLAPTSYVALMRKQKATVWCDRSQTLDPRTAAAQKAAKHRAALEVHGAGSGRTSTINSSGGKVRSAKAGSYVPANLSGVSVPVRLSANEMLGDEEEAQEGRSIGDAASATARVHNRSGSGRSSVHSAKYPSGYPRPNQGGRFSTGSTPPSGNEGPNPEANDNIPEVSETPFVDPQHPPRSENDYFTDSTGGVTQNGGTPSSGEEDRFGEAGELRGPPRKSAVAIAAEQAKKAEDLRRRGSVDERTMTMGGKGRLFVANPDLDD